MSPRRGGVRRLPALLLWAVVGVALGGCQTLDPMPRGPVALESLEPLREPERGEVLGFVSRLRERARAPASLRASGRVALETPRGSGRARQILLAERPASLRLETLNVLGQTQSLLVTDGESFAFFDGRELVRGDAGEEAMRERLGIDLAPGATVSVLLASPPVAEGEALAVLGRGDVRVVELAGQRLWFDSTGELEAAESFDHAGRVLWRAQYRLWREVPGGRYPFEIVLDFPFSALHAELELDSVELEPMLDGDLFRVPRGAPE